MMESVMMEFEVKGFTFSDDYFRAIDDSENGLSEDQKASMYKAIIDYMFTGKIPQFNCVMRIIFNTIFPSLELSKTRSKSKLNKIKLKSNENQIKNKTKSNQNQTKIKSKTNKNQNKIKSKSNFADFLEEEKEKAPPLEKERSKEKEYNPPEREKEEECPFVLNKQREIDEQDGRTTQKNFFETYPEIVIDNYSASDYADIDFAILAKEFSLSKKILQKMKSFSWICSNYRRIEKGSFRDWTEDVGKGESYQAERHANAKWFDETFGPANGT